MHNNNFSQENCRTTQAPSSSESKSADNKPSKLKWVRYFIKNRMRFQDAINLDTEPKNQKCNFKFPYVAPFEGLNSNKIFSSNTLTLFFTPPLFNNNTHTGKEETKNPNLGTYSSNSR